MDSSLPAELEFLSRPFVAPSEPVLAPWLVVPFSANPWRCQFGTVVREIDFSVRLNDGSPLTSPANHRLLTFIKKFLCLQTSEIVIKGRPLASLAQQTRVYRAVHLIDYLLLNSHYLDLANNGLAAFDQNEMRLLTMTLARGRRIQRSIYNPSVIIANHLRVRITALSDRDCDGLLNAVACSRTCRAGWRATQVIPLLVSTSEIFRTLSLTHYEANVARRLLQFEGFYSFNKKHQMWAFDLGRLVEEAYSKRTLNSKPKLNDYRIHELQWNEVAIPRTERPRAPIHTNADDPRVGREYYLAYVSALLSLRYFEKLPDPVIPVGSLDVVNQTERIARDMFKEKGRFKLIPFEVTQEILEKSMDFIYSYGENIVDAMFEVYSSGALGRVRNFPALNRLCVSGWRISTSARVESYYKNLRSAPGLYELFAVLIGAIDICVETVMVRRTSELIGIEKGAEGFKEFGEMSLSYKAGKRNMQGVREAAERPMPPLASYALGLLQRLHDRAAAINVDLGPLLFILPSALDPAAFDELTPSAFVRVGHVELAECIDMLCDYLEFPCDPNGCRYYVRNHQLRRSFGFQFIWCGFFGGVDTLGWFLGHGGKAATSRYFTELLSGDAVALKTSIAARLIKEQAAPAFDLAKFIAREHGVKVENLAVLDDEVIEDWLERAVREGDVNIDVEYMNIAGVGRYRSIVLLRRKG